MKLLIVSFLLFGAGFLTVLWNRHNIIKIFIGVELGLFAASWNLVLGYYVFNLFDGLIMILFILAIAAAEAAIGLGLAVQVYLKHGTIKLDAVSEMGG